MPGMRARSHSALSFSTQSPASDAMTLVNSIEGNRPSFPHTRVLLVAECDDLLHAHARLRQRALERLGCTVATFNLLGSGGWLARARGIGFDARLSRAMAQAAPAVVLVFGSAQLTPALISALRAGWSAVWVNWFCDGQRSVDAIQAAAGSYDVVFVAGVGAATRLADAGPNPVGYLPPACDPSVHRPLRARDQFRANVVFAGSATPYREQVLGELVEFGLAVWGPGWRRTKLRDYCRGELLPHDDYVRAYAGASVAVDIPRDDGESLDFGCTRRAFELAAIGVPQVSFGCGDVGRHFDSETEVLACHAVADLKAVTRELLHNRQWAEQLAAAARQRAIAQHTYVHRMGTLLDGLGQAPAVS